MASKYFPPTFNSSRFHCPHCNVFAHQLWSYMQATETNPKNLKPEKQTFSERFDIDWRFSKCSHCLKVSVWIDGKLYHPNILQVSAPNDDLPEDIKSDYTEAAIILNDSPRAAAALLRLALQKLCKHLGEKGNNINDDIGSLVSKGLNSTIQQSLDVLRITGNNAVHPGQINLDEESELVRGLFMLINLIAEKMITEPNEVESFYQSLPETARESISERDSK